LLKKEWINYRQADNGRREACIKTEILLITFATKLIVLFVYQREDLNEREEWEHWNPAEQCCYCLATEHICVKEIKI
jgi:hypothetical protein